MTGIVTTLILEKGPIMRPLRLVRDNTHIRFMRGRLAGPMVSAVLSLASVFLFFWPGVNYGVDFRGGTVVELRTTKAADLAVLRSAFEGLQLGEVEVQGFGSPRDVRVTLGGSAPSETARRSIQDTLASRIPGTEIRSFEVVGAKVSEELFHHGLEASAAALAAILLYVWFRFDWQYGVGVVVTLLLDVTKTIGFLALTRLQFDLNTVAAILTLIGYSVTDKVVVYDRIRENVRKHRSMPLRELIDLSINQTLGRTVATSLTVLLSILPLALIGGGSIRDFAVTIIFGIIVGTSSSIFIAAPILLYLGQDKLSGAPRRPTVMATAEPE
jgi:preprotein translocase subunit SecF